MSWKFTIAIVAETGAEDRFEINEYKAGKHMKSNYMLNNPELKAVPPLLSEFSCCPQTFEDLWQCRSSCLNRSPHFLALHCVSLMWHCSDNKRHRNGPVSHICPWEGCFGVWQDLHSWCCSSQSPESSTCSLAWNFWRKNSPRLCFIVVQVSFIQLCNLFVILSRTFLLAFMVCFPNKHFCHEHFDTEQPCSHVQH